MGKCGTERNLDFFFLILTAIFFSIDRKIDFFNILNMNFFLFTFLSTDYDQIVFIIFLLLFCFVLFYFIYSFFYMLLGMRDEDDLFEGVNMTREELKKREIQKQILSMAKDKYRFNYKDEGYHMPEGYVDANGRIDKAKREGALTARYEAEEQVKTEQEQWEEDRVKVSVLHFGAKDKIKEEQYDLLVEDQIEFISHEMLKGQITKDLMLLST